jgi:hypothetical protein
MNTILASTIVPNTAAAAKAPEVATKPVASGLGAVRIEVQSLSADVPVAPKKDAALEKMVELLNQILYNAVKVNDQTLPVWTGVKIKSKGYLIYMEIPGPKRLKFVKGADGKYAVATKDGVQQYRRLPGTRIPLMNAKDFIALNKHNHDESLRQIERTFLALPYAKGLLDLVLNRSNELCDEVERRLSK